MIADGGGGPAWERDSGVLAKYLVSPQPRTGPWWLWRHVFIL